MYVPSSRQALSVVFPKWSLEQKETVSVRVAGPLMTAARLSAPETVARFCSRDPDFLCLPALLFPCHCPSLHQASGRRGSTGQGHLPLTSFGLTQPHFFSSPCPLSSALSHGRIHLPGWLGKKSSCEDFQ